MVEIIFDSKHNRHNLIIGNIYYLQDILFPNDSSWYNEDYNNKIGLFLKYKDNKNESIFNEYVFYINNKIVLVDAWSLKVFML
jgi:hypothetical protein